MWRRKKGELKSSIDLELLEDENKKNEIDQILKNYEEEIKVHVRTENKFREMALSAEKKRSSLIGKLGQLSDERVELCA